jgi:tight adherence protein B
MTPLAVGLLVFFAAMLALDGRGRNAIGKRLEHHLRGGAGGDARQPRRRRRVLTPLFDVTERALGGSRLWRKLGAALERADVSLKPAEFFYIIVAAGLAPALLLALAGVPALVVLMLFLGGSLAPCVVLAVKADRRRREFDEQLPQVLMAMAASVRVGHSFRQAMQAIVAEDHGPATVEFGRVLAEIDLGRPVDAAFADMAKRLGSKELSYVVTAITIQREVGGSLAGLFDLVAETVRQRHQFAAKVRGLTAMGRMSAYILTALPFAAVALLTAMNSSYTRPLYATSTGRILVALALGGIVLGGLMLKKIISFRLS